MEDSINNLGVVTTDKDVNDLAARHCEDAQVSLLLMYPPSDYRHCFIVLQSPTPPCPALEKR